MSDATNTEKSLAQIAYETFLSELAKAPHGAEEVEHAPDWEHVPTHVREVIAAAISAALRSFAPALMPETPRDEQSFAQVGYQAYIASTGGLNYQGLPCPEWSALPAAIKAAWSAASNSIRSEHEHRFAGDFDLEVSKDELAELIAGLDALQRADKHQGEVTFPLRSRLRGLLFPPEPVLDAEADDEAPVLELGPSNEGEKPEPAPESMKNQGAYDAYQVAVAAEQGTSGSADQASAGTDSSAAERTAEATTDNSSEPVDASEGNAEPPAPVESAQPDAPAPAAATEAEG